MAAAARKPGRPTLYRPEYAEQARKMCLLLQATDEDLAGIFQVRVVTIHEWKVRHREFASAIKEGKDGADSNVADRLYCRAMGYSHPAVKIVADAKTGVHHTVEYTEHYPPDTAACIFWLKNRQRGKWRDRQPDEEPVRAPVHVTIEMIGSEVRSLTGRIAAPQQPAMLLTDIDWKGQ